MNEGQEVANSRHDMHQMRKIGDHLQIEYQEILAEACQQTLNCEQGYRELLNRISRQVDG